MNRDLLVKQLLAIYVEELDDQVRALNRDLLALEKAPPGTSQPELFKSLLRTAHTLKGASRSVNAATIEAACHQLEEIFAALESGALEPGAELFALLFAAVDAIEEAGRRLRRGENVADGSLAAVSTRLESLAAGRGRSPAPREVAPSAPPLPANAEPSETTSAPAIHEDPIPPPPAPLTPAATMPEPEEAASTVRVAAEKLDSLLAQTGEFFVTHRRLQLRFDELDALCSSITRWQSEWSAAARTLRWAPERSRVDRLGAQRLAPPEIGRSLRELLGKTAERLARLQSEASRLASSLAADRRQLELAAGALGDEVRRVRMLPFGDACLGLDRMVRDLAKQDGKEVELVINAGGVELDRSVLEQLKDSLRHLIRNAIHHGVEPPQERLAAGKPRGARITISAALRGPQVEVSVADDGRGLDLDALRNVVRARKLAEPPSELELARMIFQPGISTAATVTSVSGRGMGLDIVKCRAETSHGIADVSFEAGRGTCVKVAVPLTLTSFRALLATAAGQTFGFVGANVEKAGRVDPAALKRIEGREMILLEEGWIPIASLAQTLRLPQSGASHNGKPLPYVVVAAGEKRLALLVDEHVAEQEIMIKSLGARIECVPHVAGATILPSGRIALVLNAASLIRAATARNL